MIRLTNIKLGLDHSEEDVQAAILDRLAIARDALRGYRVHRRSIDARRKAIAFTYTIDAEVDDEAAVLARRRPPKNAAPAPSQSYALAVSRSEGEALRLSTRPIVIGTGPCGLFAGLLLAQMGLRPLVLERGKPACERARDVYRFWETGALDPSSNTLFGEGGAGTFSDGKLNTQIKDRGHRCRKVLEELAAAGAPEEILWLNKPHIGTDNLIGVVTRLRETIGALGGEVQFGRQVTGLLVEDETARGVVLADGEEIPAAAVVLAIGHSARDTFSALWDQGVTMEQKPFSIGVRIEHPQSMIDNAQFGRFAGHPRLGAADYRLVHHCGNGRSVYTFCMCPGGHVIGASSEPGQVVTNGMSAYHRDAPNANSALLVGVSPKDFGGSHPLAGVIFQRRWEEQAFALGGANYHAPAQLVGDLLAGRASQELGEVAPSYRPGVTLCDLAECLPGYVVEAMREGLPALDRKLRGFARPDAVLTGVETRSSSPVRIPRGPDCQSTSVKNLYPAGEGAGYAGGILSAAADGVRVAEAVARQLVGGDINGG